VLDALSCKHLQYGIKTRINSNFPSYNETLYRF
jgi:hypothetical protein